MEFYKKVFNPVDWYEYDTQNLISERDIFNAYNTAPLDEDLNEFAVLWAPGGISTKVVFESILSRISGSHYICPQTLKYDQQIGCSEWIKLRKKSLTLEFKDYPTQESILDALCKKTVKNHQHPTTIQAIIAIASQKIKFNVNLFNIPVKIREEEQCVSFAITCRRYNLNPASYINYVGINEEGLYVFSENDQKLDLNLTRLADIYSLAK
jgi:hypothetical protein